MGPLSTRAFVWISLVKVVVVFGLGLAIVALLTLAERRIAAWIQDRSGPNRVGPWGLFQPLADGLKNLLKEENLPAAANRALFFLAPMISIVPALIVFAIIPFAAPLPTRWGLVKMVIADVPIGILFLIALASLGVYGIVLAGWASGSKYSLLGGLRASAQMISYEVGLGLSLVPILMLSGNVSLTEIVWLQQRMGLWYIFPLMMGFVLFVTASFAETNRLPFDLPEAESELVAGYHTEYSAMKFAMFFIAEYANLFTASALMTTFFFGGWDIPFWAGDNIHVLADGTLVGAAAVWWKTVLTLLSFGAKTVFFAFVFIWVRWTLPRFRYDQVMALGWKVLIPVAVTYVALLGGLMVLLDRWGVSYGPTYGFVLTGFNVICLIIFVWLLDRGRIITGASESARRQRVLARREADARRAGGRPAAGVASD